jgi:chemotaxis protein methyltransferase CheR
MDDEERLTMADAITTNETHFFGSGPFSVSGPAGLAGLAGRRAGWTIRVWSAGCATGQEPYSLAMTLVDRFPSAQGWSVEILATDLSRRASAIAENTCNAHESLYNHGLPKAAPLSNPNQA